MSTTDNECPICYETISSVNNCVTTCNHSFCLNCILRCSKSSNCCPICRSEFLEDDNLDDSPDDYATVSDVGSDDLEDGNEEDEYDDDDSDEDESSIEYITEMLLKKGITIIDVVSICINRFSKSDSKFTREFCEELENKFYGIIDDADKQKTDENDESILMALEDKRTNILTLDFPGRTVVEVI